MAVALRQRLQAALLNDVAIDREVDACLDRVFLVDCFTSRDLLAALRALRQRVDALPTRRASTAERRAGGAAASGPRKLTEAPRLLLIDTLSASQWLERGDEQGRKRERAEGVHQSPMENLSEVLGPLRQRLSVVWTRQPLTNDQFCEFPVVEPIAAPTLAALVPSVRLRLRPRLRLPPDERKAARDGGTLTMQSSYHALLEQTPNQHGTASANARHELHWDLRSMTSAG